MPLVYVESWGKPSTESCNNTQCSRYRQVRCNAVLKHAKRITADETKAKEKKTHINNGALLQDEILSNVCVLLRFSGRKLETFSLVQAFLISILNVEHIGCLVFIYLNCSISAWHVYFDTVLSSICIRTLSFCQLQLANFCRPSNDAP